MSFYHLRSLTLSLMTLILILAVSGVLIAYGRGYRINVTDGDVQPTGLLAATSDPTGAQVLVDGKLKTATNQTINLEPNWYDVSIVKEGFTTWKKRVRVQGEVVSRADAFLIPTNPSLSTLSTAGVVAPALSPDGSKIAYLVPPDPQATVSSELVDRAGVWIYDMTDQPLGFNRDQRQIMKAPGVDLTGSVLAWSPDSKNVLLTTPDKSPLLSYYLLEENKLNDPPRPIIDITSTLNSWKTITEQKHAEKLAAIPKELIPIASSSMSMITFSPEENKFLYVATASATLPPVITPPLIGTNPTEQMRDISPNKLYVYDLKEDRNYLLGDTKTFKPFPLPTPKIRTTPQLSQTQAARMIAEKLADVSVTYVQWLPTSRHLILVSPDKIDVMEYDGANRTTAYSGPFGESFVAPWSDASKLVIITNLNQTAIKRYNLYTVNLR